MRGHWLVVVIAGAAVVSCKKAETKPAVISVSVSHLKANGRTWDDDANGADARPDIAVCISYATGRHCYNGDKPNVSEAVCHDALTCQTKLDIPPAGDVSVEVWDVDSASEELIAKGPCAFGTVCKLPGCTVAIGPEPQTLAEPPKAVVATCASTPLEAAHLASLPAQPKSASPINRRTSQLVDIYDYEAPACAGSMLTVDSDDPTSWSFRCHRSCVDPAKAGLGTLKKLVTDESDAGPAAKTTWYLITDGPLNGHVAAFTPLPEGGNEIAVSSVAGIQDEPAYFISGWLCKNQNQVPKVSPTKCQ